MKNTKKVSGSLQAHEGNFGKSLLEKNGKTNN
jgi:hypothetical protein